MDRYWFLTWITYGNWLPGDPRGFVGQLRDPNGLPFIHNLPGTPYDADLPPLAAAMRAAMKGPPIRLQPDQAPPLLDQFQETAAYRGWVLLAVGIMANHLHLVVGVPGDPEPHTILHSFKSYASRKLNRRWGKPMSDTWWTESGSTRPLKGELSLIGAVEYVRDQPYPLFIWLNEPWLRSNLPTIDLLKRAGERGQ